MKFALCSLVMNIPNALPAIPSTVWDRAPVTSDGHATTSGNLLPATDR